MRNNISDKGSNFKYFACAGAFILLLFFIGNNTKTIYKSSTNSDNEFICEWQGKSYSQKLFVENVNEDDLNKKISDCNFKVISTGNIFCTDLFVSAISQLISNKSKNYHQNDLSPPYYI